MKKMVALALALICVIGLLGCSKKSIDNPESQTDTTESREDTTSAVTYKVEILNNYPISNELKGSYEAGEWVTVKLEAITEHYYKLYVNGEEQDAVPGMSDDFTYYTFIMPAEDVMIEIKDFSVDIPTSNDSQSTNDTLDKKGTCKHNWVRTDNLNEYTAADKCLNCGNVRMYTDPDKEFNTENEAGLNMLRYSWDGYGVGKKKIYDCGLGYAIIECLSGLQETGDFIPEISEEEINAFTVELPVTKGTVWLECGSVGLFRLDPQMTEICKVQTHLGEGKVLQMTDTLKQLLELAWYYYPSDYWSGTYENGNVTLQQEYKNKSVVEWVRIENICIDSESHSKNNQISLRIMPASTQTVEVELTSYQSDDNLYDLYRKEIDLIDGEETVLDLEFYGNHRVKYSVVIKIDNTRINLLIKP